MVEGYKIELKMVVFVGWWLLLVFCLIFFLLELEVVWVLFKWSWRKYWKMDW